LLGAGVGTVLGLAQWLVLRPHSRQASWWVFASALAWAWGLLVAFIATGIVILNGFSIQTILVEGAVGAILGVVVGAITGFALVWLLKPRLENPVLENFHD
ncbi:MAG: hypothetical protein VKJ46_01500, partial [Leptolyngbyaceae bacterium]|nr:hypothetical protein [Leptolyngbyaceae bacterium]